MAKTNKVNLRRNELKKMIKNNKFYDKKKLYKFYVSKVDTNENIELVDYQTISNDLKCLQVEPDPDTNILSLPSQIQINNYIVLHFHKFLYLKDHLKEFFCMNIRIHLIHCPEDLYF